MDAEAKRNMYLKMFVQNKPMAINVMELTSESDLNERTDVAGLSDFNYTNTTKFYDKSLLPSGQASIK